MGVQSRGESPDETITVTTEGQWYVATDESSGVASHGETNVEAVDARRLHSTNGRSRNLTTILNRRQHRGSKQQFST